MKKIFALILAAMLLFSGFSFAAEKDYTTITVGTYTPLTGNFFSDMWGSSTSDIDARELLHSYSLVTFDSATGTYSANQTVVSGFVVTENDFHDHVYSIAICNDLKYSDGKNVTAWDYAFTFLLMADPAVAELSGQAKDLSFLKGAEEYRTGESDVISGIHVSGDYMIEITIDHDVLPFFYELSYLDVSPYPIKTILPGYSVKDTGSGVCLSKAVNVNTLKKNLLDEKKGYISHPSVVSGPYTLKSFDGEKAVFKRNKYFKGDAEGNTPIFETINFVPVTTENAAEKLASGEVDLVNKAVSTAATESATELVGSGYKLTAYPRTGLSLVSFCCESPKASSDSVRKALAMVFDKEGFTTAYTGSNGLVTEGFYGLGQWMYQVVSGAMAAPVEEPDENATSKERKAYEKSLEDWSKLNLDDVKVWDGTAEEAAALLNKNGWNLNEKGEKFNAATDTVRARKDDDGNLITLEMTLCCPAGTGVKAALEEYFVKPAAEIGIVITVEELEWEELLARYYRTTERSCDMIYIATNFDSAFDPSSLFDPSDEAQGYANRTGITDEKLYKRAVAMHDTEPGDTYNYCKKWIAFQETFSDVMPVIPVYTNVYFDFYADVLRNYEISSYSGWSNAIIKAYMSDFVEEEETEEEDEFVEF